MITYVRLAQYPKVFLSMTGLRPSEFEAVLDDVAPRYQVAETQRLARPERQRAIGGGRDFDLSYAEQVLLTVVWLRLYPVHEVLAFLFGISDSSVSRYIGRILPLLEASGRDTMRMPDPGKKRHRTLTAVLEGVPELNVIVDTFEQRVQRPRTRSEADPFFSGKKKQHTLKEQVVVDEATGEVVTVGETAKGPTADVTLLKASDLMRTLPPGIGILGDLAYIGIGALHPLGVTPRRKPRGQERPPEDRAFNRAFAQRRIQVEHTIGRFRRYQALTQMDRNHRRGHTARTVAIAGFVNRQIRHRLLAC